MAPTEPADGLSAVLLGDCTAAIGFLLAFLFLFCQKRLQFLNMFREGFCIWLD